MKEGPRVSSHPRSNSLVDAATQYCIGVTLQGRQTQVNDHNGCLPFGLVAVWESETLSGLWNPKDSHLHINLLELMAVQLAIFKWGPDLRNHQVTILCDNTTTVSYINHQGGTRSTHSLPRPGNSCICATDTTPQSFSPSRPTECHGRCIILGNSP